MVGPASASEWEPGEGTEGMAAVRSCVGAAPAEPGSAVRAGLISLTNVAFSVQILREELSAPGSLEPSWDNDCAAGVLCWGWCLDVSGETVWADGCNVRGRKSWQTFNSMAHGGKVIVQVSIGVRSLFCYASYTMSDPVSVCLTMAGD